MIGLSDYSRFLLTGRSGFNRSYIADLLMDMENRSDMEIIEMIRIPDLATLSKGTRP